MKPYPGTIKYEPFLPKPSTDNANRATLSFQWEVCTLAIEIVLFFALLGAMYFLTR